jgi:drug/metabolite transporter (DMT)-like permease
VVLFGGHGPDFRVVGWGALSGIGSAIGTLALYRGLAVGRMSTVATVSAVLTAVIPVIVGVALGNRLGTAAVIGIVIAVPAIALVSHQPRAGRGDGAGSGLLYGLVSGLGFALLFIALDRAGTHAGAWPLLPGQFVSLLPIAPFALRDVRRCGRPSRELAGLAVGAGVLSGMANLLFLAATGHGQLAVVAVLTALYPAVTVVLARVALGELWTPLQAAGLIVAATSVALVTV